MKLSTIAAVAAAGVALSGCATIIKGTTQSISVNTASVTGAQCTLTSSEGTWYVVTPGTVVVHKTKHDIDATCRKAGYRDANATIPSHFNGATVGNVLLGGLIGVGVDAASGANYNYPDDTQIVMAPMGAPIAVTPPPVSGKPTS
jgi:hypothetical protein